MEIINHQLINDGVVLADLPKLAVNALVRVWSVPTEYQASGYFVSTDNTIPACDHGEPVFIGELEADADAVIAAEQQRLIATITAEVQQRLDGFAQTRNYDGILSACTYATSTVPQFATEGQYCVNARDSTWAALYAVMADVQAGTIPMPSGIDDISLPVLEWPE